MTTKRTHVVVLTTTGEHLEVRNKVARFTQEQAAVVANSWTANEPDTSDIWAEIPFAEFKAHQAAKRALSA